MRLFRFLSEASHKTEILYDFSEIEKLCPNAVNSKIVLYRGMPNVKEEMGKTETPTDRIPRDSSKVFHTLMNNAFYKVFGIYARSQTIFATGLLWAAKSYGTAYQIWPADDFTVIYSNYIKDLYRFMDSNIQLSTDSINAFCVVQALIANTNESLDDKLDYMDFMGASYWFREKFPKEFELLQDNKITTTNAANVILKAYPNCIEDFVKKHYICGKSITDLQKAAATKKECMIHCKYYCWQRV